MDILIERSYIERQTNPVYAVQFVDWQQADAIRELLGAVKFDLHVALTAEDPPQVQFFAEFFADGSAFPDLYGRLDMTEGDYLVTFDPPPPEDDNDTSFPRRRWEIVDKRTFEATRERYRPEKRI